MDLRYPIGKYESKISLTPAERAEAIAQIAETPKRMRDAVGGLSGGQLDTPYRPGGWTVRQVAHHVPDSHMNAYVRLKLALTENEPTVKPYEEGLWAELAGFAGNARRSFSRAAGISAPALGHLAARAAAGGFCAPLAASRLWG